MGVQDTGVPVTWEAKSLGDLPKLSMLYIDCLYGLRSFVCIACSVLMAYAMCAWCMQWLGGVCYILQVGSIHVLWYIVCICYGVCVRCMLYVVGVYVSCVCIYSTLYHVLCVL